MQSLCTRRGSAALWWSLHAITHPAVLLCSVCHNLLWQLKSCLSISELIHKLWYHPDNGIYSVIKINEIWSHKKTWRNLNVTLLSERSQSVKATYCMIPTLTFWKRQSYGENCKIRGCQRLGMGAKVELLNWKKLKRRSRCGAAEMDLTSIHENVGLIPCLSLWVGDLALLWVVV